MRILASRKRDSVTGEEVVTFTRVVGSSSSGLYGRNYSSNSGVVPANFDLPRKSTNPVESDNLLLSSRLSFKRKSKSGSGEGQGCEKVGKIWKSWVGKGLAFFCNILSGETCSRRKNVNRRDSGYLKESCYTTTEVWKTNLDYDFYDANCQALNAFADQSSSCCCFQEDARKVHETGNKGDSCIEECDNNLSKKCVINDNNCEAQSKIIVEDSASPSASGVVAEVLHKRPQVSPSRPDYSVDETDSSKFVATGIAIIKIMRTGIYHEKQVKSLCALHALNNLLQDGKAFKQEDLDKICSELDPNSWVNPHKSVFGLGNYDINVIMTALQQKQLEAIWFDKRKDPSEELNFDNIYGFILNIPSDCRLGWLALPIKRKHWVAIRNLPSVTEKEAGRSNYYNLDSKFDKPESIGSMDNVIEYLRGELKSPEKELFLVVTEDVGRIETWRKNPPSSSGAASGTNSNLLPVPTSGECSYPDASAGSGSNNRRTSNDSGVVDLLPDLKDINVVDLNKEDLMRRQSSGVWSDLT